jgi:hypothetical protein
LHRIYIWVFSYPLVIKDDGKREIPSVFLRDFLGEFSTKSLNIRFIEKNGCWLISGKAWPKRSVVSLRKWQFYRATCFAAWAMKLRFIARAKVDLVEIYEYFAQENPIAARQVIAIIQAAQRWPEPL